MLTCQNCNLRDAHTDTCTITGNVAWHGDISPSCPFNVELTNTILNGEEMLYYLHDVLVTHETIRKEQTKGMKAEHYKVIFNKGGHWLSLQFKLAGDAVKAFNFLRVNDINLTVVLMKGNTTYLIGNGGNYTTINDIMREV